jgi:hypothetical protein
LQGHYLIGVMLFKNMKIDNFDNKSANIIADIEEIEVYPAWFTTKMAHIRINDKKNNRWTDCYISAIVKNGKIRFDIHHDRGYPSEQKGTVLKTVTANWLNNKLPKL